MLIVMVDCFMCVSVVLLCVVGVFGEEVDVVVVGCVNVNFVGYDFYGVIVVFIYIDCIKVGYIVFGV